MALEFLSPLHKASRQITMYLEDQTRELNPLSPASSTGWSATVWSGASRTRPTGGRS
jgi:hypothetical protein